MILIGYAGVCCAVLLGVLVMLVPLGAASAESDMLPEWVKTIFVFYAEGHITDVELLAAIEYLAVTGVISVPSVASLEVPYSDAEYKALADGKMPDDGDFYLVYEPNPNSYYDVTAKEWLQDYELLELEVEWLNENFRLPHDVQVTARECGEINAFYYDGEITICYEFIDDLFDLWFGYSGWDPDDPDTFVYADEFAHDVTYETFYHEVGHALMDVYDLPYTGKEENVADQFSALILSYTYDEGVDYDLGQEMLYNVGNYYLYNEMRSENHQDQEPAYWGRHGLDVQRFYDVSCYAYGANPAYNQDLIDDGWLPEERAEWCEYEYAQMAYAWNYLLRDYTNGFFD